MDNLRRKTYSESLKTTLNCYQLSSADSLSGPSSYSALAAQLWFKENKQSPPIPPPPLIQIPLLMPNDTSTQRSETILAGERISCFIVGGEKRLCLPQILTSVLREFSISEINRTCAELHIYCSRCSPDQLEILKVLGILPFNTTQCGLITKTDAERLVSALVYISTTCSKVTVHCFNVLFIECDIKGIRVYHECFGRGDGIFYPEFYLSPDSPCVSCLDCRISFSPARFVSHSHRGLEKHTCHWGFDPENWRNYLLVPKDKESGKQNDLENLLKSLKAKFNFSNSPFGFNTPSLHSSLKRKQHSASVIDATGNFISSKVMVNWFKNIGNIDTIQQYLVPFNMRSAFKPWHSALGHTTTHVSEFSRHQEALTNALLPVIRNRRSLPDPEIMSPKTLQKKEPAATPLCPSILLSYLTYYTPIYHRLHRLVTYLCIADLTPTKQPSPEKKHPSSAVTTSSNQHEDSKQFVSSIAGINDQHTSPVHTLDSVPPLVAMSNAVAAASAMLELSSSGQHRNTSVDLEKENKSSQHNSLLEKESDKQLIVHELVKMKSRFEEKLDIQARVKRDLEAELEQVKALKKRRLEEATDARNEMQQEMDAMRHEHDMRIQDVNKMLADIWKQVDELK
uniref:c-SKI SMAD4-binding domain-containing protein n=1 Tax=Ciona intestinalis TaxID=7719 RepID=F6TS32_CIOIN